MSETFIFHPPRRKGLMIHTALVLALAGASAITFLIGMNQAIGTNFILLLVLSLLLFAPLPYITYRAYALTRATYRIQRDGLQLRWGLRAEDIPLPDVEWVRRVTDLAADIPMPRLRWPGAYLGTINVHDLGQVEFLAATQETMLLIATGKRIYAISPEDPSAFLRAFQKALEMGSLTPLSSVSVQPAAYLSQIWKDQVARALLAGGFALSLVLFIGVSLAMPGRQEISLGFSPDGQPLPPGPSAQMLLLPVLGAFLYIVDLAIGLFFYRRTPTRPAAYLVWGSGGVTALLLIAAALFIL